MRQSLAMIFSFITNIFSMFNRLSLAGDAMAESVEAQAYQYRDEELAKLKSNRPVTPRKSNKKKGQAKD